MKICPGLPQYGVICDRVISSDKQLCPSCYTSQAQYTPIVRESRQKAPPPVVTHSQSEEDRRLADLSKQQNTPEAFAAHKAARKAADDAYLLKVKGKK
jgi:hypothetical protein